MEVENQDFDKQIDELLAKEKTARMQNDHLESIRILKAVTSLCYSTNRIQKLNELLVMLCKKRGQPKKAQIEVVQQCMTYLPEIQDKETKISLIYAIRQVSEKKIYLEVEYARCVLLITKLKEDENEIADAAKILQEVQIETYGSMDKREKLEFILYQMNIMIKKKDYVRLYIISKKIEPKNIEDKKIGDLKITYYSYLVHYYKHEQNYIETANAYGKILETLNDNSDNSELKMSNPIDFGFNIDYKNMLECYVLYLCISSYSNDKKKRLQEVYHKYQYQIEEHKILKNLIKLMLSLELISTNSNEYNVFELEIFQLQEEFGQQRRNDFRKQLIQHNLMIFQKYYDSIHLNRISQLINISKEEIEEEICAMIEAELLVCKIDRLNEVVQFVLNKNENEVLDEWGKNINKVLDMLELTSNIIKREEEQYL